MNNGNIKRTYKDSLFRMIFREKKELLSLYNAINSSDYSDPELLEVNTIEDVLYMGIKNDISFLISDYLNLYEVQSTWNPNMPLRGVFYFSQLYQGYVAEHEWDLYGSRLLTLPTPKYIVFFNGTKEIGERMEVRLSDAFFGHGSDAPALECTATYLNINYGHNQELMSQCKKLREYSFLIDRIRKELALNRTLKDAVDAAVQYCISHKILDKFLRKHRTEVTDMILTGYADQLHWKSEKKISYQEGFNEGLEAGIQVVIKLFRAQNMPEEEILAQVMKEFSVDKETAEHYMEL